MKLLENNYWSIGDKVVCINWEGSMVHNDKVYVVKDLNSHITDETHKYVDVNRLYVYKHIFRKAYKNE